MGKKWRKEELPLLMLATVAVEEEEKETKKLEDNFILQFPPCPKKKRSVLYVKKRIKKVEEESIFKNCFHQEGLKNSRVPSSSLPLEASISCYPKRKRSILENVYFDYQEKGVQKKQKLSIMEEGEARGFKNKILEEEGFKKKWKFSVMEEKGFQKKWKFSLIQEEGDIAGEGFKKTECTEKNLSIMDDLVPEIKKNKTRKIVGTVKNRKKALDDDDLPNPPPGLPEKLKNLISTLAAENREISLEKLVVQNRLEHSDLDEIQNRFSMPMGLSDFDFLDEYEKVKRHKFVNLEAVAVMV